MRNAFKLMGVALVAGSLLFAACKKDDVEPNGDNNNNVNLSVAEGTAKVTFGDMTFNVGGAYLQPEPRYADGSIVEGILEVVFFKNVGSYPYVELLGRKTPGTYTAQMQTATAYPGTDTAYTYPTGTGTNDINNIVLRPSQDEYWLIWDATYKLYSIDLNALTATLTIDATMWDYAQWYYVEVNDVEDADTRELHIEANNFQFLAMPQQ